uniref:Uncharacterized protein n=1 Tax=Romanomermis culicivorax TaxID=13658 RepID=A0A915HLN8_ROMCU
MPNGNKPEKRSVIFRDRNLENTNKMMRKREIVKPEIIRKCMATCRHTELELCLESMKQASIRLIIYKNVHNCSSSIKYFDTPDTEKDS